MKHKVKIIDIIDEAKGTKTYLLEKPENYTWVEGSHTHIGLVGFDEGEKPNKDLVRHMSIMTLPTEEKIGFTTRAQENPSEFKYKLSQLSVGDEVVIFKLGSRMELRRCNRPIVLLSMGVGIATMRPLILAYINDLSNIPSLFHVNVDASGDIYRNELDKYENEQYKNYWLDSRINFYETLNQLTETQNAIYYIVGNDLFIKDIIQKLRARNVDDVDIILDKKPDIIDNYFEN
jgi:ferredoxin-NADP reductase